MSDVSKLVLVVDDEELNVDMLSRRLTRSGFRVHIATDGQEALARIAQHDYELVLLDHMMPGMSGREVLAQLRQTHTAAKLPVIMVTAVAESDKIAEALSAGANDYITKPIDYRVALARMQVQLSRKEAEDALRQSEERYALATKASRDGLWDWDLTANRVYFSPRWLEMSGVSAAEETTSPELWFDLVFQTDTEPLRAYINKCVSSSADCLTYDYRLEHPDGSLRWMTTRAIISRDASGIAIRISGSQADVTSERTEDPLTTLPNRVALKSMLEALFLRLRRSPAHSRVGHGLLFLDLDGFKAVNDSLGHLAGDRLLCAVADKLRCASSKVSAGWADGPLVARMSGDEFAVLLRSPTVEDGARKLALEVQSLMRDPIVVDGNPIHVAFSIGVAFSDEAHKSFEELLYDADTAMYSAKANGRGSIAFFDKDLRQLMLDRLQLENDLRGALDNNEFFLVYQPKVRLSDGHLYGMEALLRWQHPTRGVINPSVFIPVAEEIGCIIEIGRWVLREACKQLMVWRRLFLIGPDLELSVNLSPREFCQEHLIEGISSVLAETGFPPKQLHLEITEGVLLEDMQRARVSLLALKALGVGLDLDDFGSGYSSLRYLQELPFDTLKIDRYFLTSLDTDLAGASSMLATIVAMAGHLDMKVVAEGVERPQHSNLLREMGCDFGQGYLFSRPVVAPDFEVLLRDEAATRRQQHSNDVPAESMFTPMQPGLYVVPCA